MLLFGWSSHFRKSEILLLTFRSAPRQLKKNDILVHCWTYNDSLTMLEPKTLFGQNCLNDCAE